MRRIKANSEHDSRSLRGIGLSTAAEDSHSCDPATFRNRKRGCDGRQHSAGYYSGRIDRVTDHLKAELREQILLPLREGVTPATLDDAIMHLLGSNTRHERTSARQNHTPRRADTAAIDALIPWKSAIDCNDTYRIITIVKVRDVIKMIERDGWFHVGTEGDHRQYKHPAKKGRVTISGHPGEDMPKGTLNNVLKQADLKK